MRKQSPNWTSALAPFCPATLDCLGRNEARDDSFILGGTSQDGNIGWLARGNALEVFSGTSGERLAAWCFGNILREPSTYITCVCTYDCDSGCKMIIATSSETSRAGMLCLFCIKTSKVIRAIEVPCKVTAMELICVTGQTRDMPTLGEQLKSFCGILAVGTDGGHTFLLDMCLDDESVDGGELQLNEMCFISPRTSDIASVRYVAQSRRQNLALELGEDTQTKGWYLYRRPDSSVAKKYNAGHVTISCLKYMPQTGMLAVGFNFGCFQLWRLNVPVLEYSSRFEDDLAPVSTFAYQEPENDPRYFCYLWVGRGPLPHHDTDEYASTVMLFQMEFDKKTWYDSLGHVFEELTSVGPRFQHELTGDVKSPVEGSSGQNFGSRIIACSNLVDPRSMTNKGSDDQSFDDGGPSSLRLCMFAWEVQTLAPQSQHSCVLGVFDMNRWYHAQMPVSISVGASHEECPFFAFCSLDDVLAASNSEAVVTAHIPHLSITKFSPVLSPPDQHSYPSALSFDVFGISESGIVRAKFLGIQRQILADMLHGGTAVLIDPTEMYNRCLSAALLPRHMERSSIAVSLIDKREAVLSVALHHNLIGFITGCITQSTSSSDYVGTLRLVVEWAWRTVTKIKESLDTICEPLHDWSGLQLDLESVQKLHHHNVALVHLVTIFQMLATHSATTTEQGRQELETKLAVLILIQQHVSIVVWFLSAGLLPEYSEERESSTDQFVYAAMKLQETYKQRRKVILQLPSEVRSTDILLIDGLVAAVGSSLSDLWLKDGSSTPNYPAPNLHALLNMYLLEDVSLASKHHITFYLLCDVYSTLPDELQVDFGDRLQQFGQRFGLPLGISRLLQGFWLLDHGDFEDSLSYLLDPLVSTDQMLPWQHTRIIKSLLYQGESRLALRYVRVKSPPMLTRGDIKLQLTVLLANGLISEAFEFQRSCRDKASAEDLLSHLFRGAQQTKTVDKLLQLPFTEEEETDLVRYLQGSEDKQAQELLVLYYLQRARFVEAVRLNDVLRKSDSDSGEVAVSRASMRNAIVDGYMRVLPGVQRRMSASLKGFMSRPSLLTKYKFVRPTPLSTVVHRSMKVKAVTQATLINSVLNKVHEVRTAYGGDDDNEEEMPRLDPEELDVVPDPFVGTPVAPRATRRSHTVNEIMFGPSTEISVRLMSPSSVSKRRLTSHLDVGMATGSPRINRSYAADAISLLQTPPVRRHTGGLKGLSSAHRQPDFVPQSIIKTKSTEVKRVNVSVSVTDGGRAGITWPAMPELPTPPRPGRHKATKISEAVSAIQVTTDIECTPKQLRFAEPASEKQGNDSPETEPSSTSATPRLSFQHAVEHTKSAMRSQQKDPSSPKTGSARRGSPKLRHKDKKGDSDDSEEEDTAATYVEVDSDITFNFTTNLTAPHTDMDTTDGPWEDTVSSSSGSTSPRKQTRRNSKKSNQRNSRGQKGGSSGGNKDEDMDVEEEGSDVEEQDSDVGSDMTRQGNDLVSLLGRERSPKELSVEHEEQLSAGESSSERLVTTPSPRLPLHHDTPSTELNRQSLFVMDGGSVGVSGDIGVTASEASLHENKVTAQASLIELRRSGAMSLDAGDAVNPVTAMHDLSSVTQRFTRFKEVRETVSSVSSHRVVNAYVLQNLSVDLQTPPRPTRVSNLPLTPPLSRSPLSLSRSPLRSHSMQQGLPQPSSLALRSTRSTSTLVTSPGHSRPSTSPIMTRASSRCASPSVAVGRSDSPVQQASSSSLRYSPSPDRSLSHSPQVTRRSGIRSKSRSVTPTQDVSKGNVVDVDSAMETKSSVGKLNTAKGTGSSVSNTDIMQSNVKCDDANVQVSSSRHVTLTRSESSSLSCRAMSIESLEATLNIPKSATKAFRSSTRKTRPSVSKSASKSVVKSALKSMTKSKKQHQEEDVEQAEDTTSQDHGSRGPLSGESFMMSLRTRPNSESRNSPEQKTVTTKDTTVENFTFSAPSEVTRDQSNMNEEGTHAVSRTPIQPFIFSPPITRTRSRVHRKEVAPPISMVIPEISALSPARNTRLASKRTQKQKEEKKKLQHSVIDESPSDSVINFVSPVTSAEETGSRRRGKLVHPAGYSMTLRQKKAGKPKRNTLKW